MSQFLTDRPHLWHGNIMKLILTVGLLSLLAVSGIKAQTGHSITTEDAMSASVEAGMTTPAQVERFCKQTNKRMYRTECEPCIITRKPCNPGSEHVFTEHCSNSTCRRVCWEDITTDVCCHGYWGGGCIQECPGGSRNPCNGQGKCSRIYGLCDCEPGFEGTACELCTDVTKYWPNCSLELGMTITVQDERVCKQTYKRTHKSECQPCTYKGPSPCHPGSVYVKMQHCPYNGLGLNTCRITCMEEYTTKDCCLGFWGDGCMQECPGGSRNPCNGHGKCSSKNGQCVCEAGFKGTACEMCTNVSKSWPNCSLEDAMSASTETGMTTPAQVERFCKQTYKRTYQTECRPCRYRGSPCEAGSVLAATTYNNCTDIGVCRFVCREEYTPEYCCHGFWGNGCIQECPGGSRNPCNGHGKCNRINGQCVCEPGFKGTACELCTDVTKYGPNCSLECPGGSRNPCNGHGECNRKNGQCICEPGFKGTACELCTDVTKYGPDCSLELAKAASTEAGMITPAQAKRVCKQTYKRTERSKCQPCVHKGSSPCQPGGVHVTTQYCPFIGYGFNTCRVTCEVEYTTEKCCLGFWGDNCTQECPGGSRNPCNGHGKCCSKNGQCVCQAGFKGTACERCTNVTKSWPNCSLEVAMSTSTEADIATPALPERFCKQTYQRKYQTECYPCIFKDSPCHPGSVDGAFEHCSDGETCRFVCFEKYTPEYCCHGFWGDGCIQECPGGSRNPCNGHGECNRINGQCYCEPGFEGTACELCTNITKYGPNCSLDCKCEDGECNNGIHGDGLCARDNPCQSSVSPCGNNSQCIHIGPGRHRCAFHDGNAGDGAECADINPCQNNNGGCHVTTHCVYMGPNQHKCLCKDGYEGDPNKRCTIKDTCSPGYCGSNTVCKTQVPYSYRCFCKEGYTWSETFCARDIIKETARDLIMANCTFIKEGERNCTCPDLMVIDGTTCRRRTIAEEIMEHPKLARLSRIMKIVNDSSNILDVVNTGYTFFAPDKRAFLKKFKKHKKSLEYWSREENALSFLKFHTIKHSYSTDDLMASDGDVKSYPTLYDGYSLHIENIKQNLHIYSSHSAPAVIKRANISAVNGYIHIINQVLVPFIPDSLDPFITTLLWSNPKYTLFYEALQETRVLDRMHVLKEYTLFVFPNEVVQRMKKDITAEFLEYHILRRRVSTNAVLDKTVEYSILGSRYKLSMKRLRRKIYVNNVEITRPNMWTDFGVVHEVADILRPVNNRCDWNSSERILIRECCAGYFGPACDLCPGGPFHSCSGHGVCDDGVNGSGKCKCNPGFYGELCEIPAPKVVVKQ